MPVNHDAVVLIAHGARDARWMMPFERMAADLKERLSPVVVALAFMEFAPPTFEEAVRHVHETGARRVLVVPVFLSGGGHVAKDVPELIRPLRERYPELIFEVAGAIGEEPEVAVAMKSAVVRLVGR